MPVAELYQRMSVQEFCHWMAFAEEEPLPSQLDRQFGRAKLAILGNGFGGKDGGGAYSYDDFLKEPWAEAVEAINEDATSYEALVQFVGGLSGK
jgi:hypothetical protein